MSSENENKPVIVPKVYSYEDLPCPSYDGKYRVLDEPLVKYITNRVRKTIEYRNLIDYMKKTMNISHCSFYKDYSMENGFTIELHHAPLTLFDITYAVARKFYAMDTEDPHIEPWRVEEEVNLLHYEFLVGLVPVNPTAHQLIHSGELRVHARMVEGNWRRFMTEYAEWVDDEVRGKIEEFVVFGKTDPDKVPELVKYTPVLISNLKIKSLGDINLQELIVEKLKERFMINQK